MDISQLSPTDGVSSLRIVGLVGGIAAVVYFALGRRSYNRRQYDWAWVVLILVALPLIALSLFPGVLSVPAEILFSPKRPGSQIDVLLIFCVAVLWILALRNRFGFNGLRHRANSLVSSLAIANFERESRVLPQGGIWVVVPALNEQENLSELIPAIFAQEIPQPLHVLVVDDGSTDQSRQVACAKGAMVLSMPMNTGGGLALKTGFRVATDHEASVVVTMDGDGQHLPEQIGQLIEPILKNQADVVIGSRFLGMADRVSAMRSAGLILYNWLISLLMGTKITDCASGFRAISGPTLSKLDLRQEQYHTAELILEALKHGETVTERPVTIRRRSHGHSKKGHDIFYGFMFMRTIVKTWLR